jgi:DNA-binding response OmpR family regulator
MNQTLIRQGDHTRMDILVYTHDSLLTDVLQIAFGSAYHVRCATTERRLFTTLASRRVGAVLLDAGQGDAVALCARLLDFSDAALIVIARTDDTAERVRLLRAGADEVLARSFKLPELAARLQAKLRRAADHPRLAA